MVSIDLPYLPNMQVCILFCLYTHFLKLSKLTSSLYVVLIGCSEVVVTNVDEAVSWLQIGNAARITSSTRMNKRSSRSHAIFTAHLSKTVNNNCSFCLLIVKNVCPHPKLGRFLCNIHTKAY